MCLIFLSTNSHPKYKLILAANRDEFYKRKTAPASFWKDHPEVLGGRDLEAQGTWLAMTRFGKLGLVTNYRDLSNINPGAPSRGQLVTDFLFNNDQPEQYLKEIHLKAEKYNGFNLIIGNQNQLYYYSNYQSKIVKMNAGFYGLCNHLLDTPWPKVRIGKEKMQPILSGKEINTNDLFELLSNEHVAPDDQLPNTGLNLERERALSAMFIKTPDYGSRCSTVILIDKEDKVLFSERVFDLTTFEYTQQDFNWKIE